MGLAFYLVFLPHLNYPYPIHHDEWMHMAYAEYVMQAGSLSFTDPFSGQFIMDITSNLEAGFHIILGLLQQVTGMSWPTLFTYFPGIIFMVTILAVYVLAQGEGFGLEAAFFTCLIPTSKGILGPAFLVPMALGLTFVPLALFVAFNLKCWQGYLLLFIFTFLLVLIHAPTAIGLCIILIPYVALNLRDNLRHSLGILLAMAAPFVLSLPWTLKSVVSSINSLLVSQLPSSFVTFPPLLQNYGLLPIALSLLGCIWLVINADKKKLGLLLGLLSLLLMLFIFYRFHIGLPILYERGLMQMVLMLSIIAGAGLFWVRNIKLSRNYTGRISALLSRNSGAVLCMLVVGIILFFSVPGRLTTSYYHMIEQEDYEAFIWIRDNLGTDYSLALLDPWKATAFTAITQKHILHRIFPQEEPTDIKISQFLKDGCPNTAFLRDNGVSVVYNELPCNNPDLVAVNKNVYVLNKGDMTRLVSVQGTLRNAGFEALSDASPAWWGTWSQNCTPAFLYPETGRSWGICVGITTIGTEASEPRPYSMWSQRVPIETGRSYRIGGWIRTKNIVGWGGAEILAHWFGPGNTWLAATSFMQWVKSTQDWTYYEGVVTAPPGATDCNVNCSLAGCSGTAWFDDLIFLGKD